MSELKPCPFCGGKAFSWLHNGDDHERYGYISCDDCAAEIKGKSLHWSDDNDAELSSRSEAAAAWNTRAVPDVPELVRWKHCEYPNQHKIMEHKEGSYVIHSQAAEIIAAKDAELNKLNVYNGSYHNQITELRELLQAAEAKLAQYEAQETVGYVGKSYMQHDKIYDEIFRDVRQKENFIPLYASPAPAADLKAENERLRKALTKISKNDYNSHQSLWSIAHDALKESSHDKG